MLEMNAKSFYFTYNCGIFVRDGSLYKIPAHWTRSKAIFLAFAICKLRLFEIYLSFCDFI
jgi:hypothetical protein